MLLFNFILLFLISKKWRIFCFRHGESSSSSGIGNPEVLKDKQTEILSVPGSELYCSKVENGHQVPNSGKVGSLFSCVLLKGLFVCTNLHA